MQNLLKEVDEVAKKVEQMNNTMNNRLAEEVAIVHLYKIIKLLIILMCVMVGGFFVWLSIPDGMTDEVYTMDADTQGNDSPISQNFGG